MEFKSFSDIEKFKGVNLHITQKIHGSNAQILIYTKEDGTTDLMCGSRNRWVTPEQDNYGFAAFVNNYKQEFIDKLGLGRHYGEWAGPGINSGEGLTEKHFILFDTHKNPPEKPLPPNTKVIPILYGGKFIEGKIEEVMEDLKTNGSKLVPNFMRPEGIVISILGQRFKKVFTAEETAWTKSSKPKLPRTPKGEVNHLLQPIRLEKLLSRDSLYIEQYPNNLPQICKDYVADLEKENQFIGTEDEIKAAKKTLGREIFFFVKTIISEKFSI